MRKVVYGAACSLDGFIARADGGVDWLLWTKDVQAVMAEAWKRFDAMLMGRKTWQVYADGSGGGGGYGGMPTYVFSRTLAKLPGKGATLVRGDAVQFVRALKEEPGGEICVMGGGDFARTLLGAGLVDEVGLNVHPVLLGSGIPMWMDPARQVDLELAECRAMAKGCVLLRYAVRGSAPERTARSRSRRATGRRSRARST